MPPARLTVVGDPTRLDRFLATHGPLAGRGRRLLATVLASGSVRVNGRRARKGVIVRAGDTITLDDPVAAREPEPETHTLALLHVDAHVIAVDKPAGLPTTAGRTRGPNVASALLARFPEMATFGDPRHAGLVHRLDTGTSGLLLAARTADAYARLRAAFARKAVEKTYLAVVVGRFAAPQTVTLPLARHRRSAGRMVPGRGATKAWPASTEVVPISGDDALTFVRLRMRTGVTHQLRVHLAALGHPIVGDRRYGKPGMALALGVDVPDWHFLHARSIAFDDADLPRALATPFPIHWRPLFTARRWTVPPD